MRLKLIKLWSKPEVFDVIKFHDGVNIILGESSGEGDQARKQNGVGKSLAIDTLRFALLKSKECRVLKVPKTVLPSDTEIHLKLEVNENPVEIIRTPGYPGKVFLNFGDENGQEFTLAEATKRFEDLLYAGHPLAGSVSFGELRSLLIREESSGYESIMQVLPAKTKASPKIEPHFLLMGIAVEELDELHRTTDELQKKLTIKRDLKKTLEEGGEKLRDIPKLLAEQRDETEKIEKALINLQADPAFAAVEADVVSLETKIKALRAKRAELSHRIHQIQSIPLPQQLTVRDLEDVYQIISDSLAEHVKKSFEQARQFQEQISNYQFRLQREELAELMNERGEFQEQIDALSYEHAQIVRQSDQECVLDELRMGLKAATERTESFYIRKERYDRHQKISQEIDTLGVRRDEALLAIKTLLANSESVLSALNRQIVEFHKFLQLSAQAALEVTYASGSTARRPVGLSLTVQDDGSKSVKRAKIFIYDLALIFCSAISGNHPRFLVHDNILEVDQDSTERALNLLHQLHEEQSDSFQYILTLNADEIESAEAQDRVNLDLQALAVATLTKESQFLKTRYMESK